MKLFLVVCVLAFVFAGSAAFTPPSYAQTTNATVSGQVTDPTGDAQASSVNPSPDMVSASVEVINSNLRLTVHFAPGTFNQNSTIAEFSLDTDQNPYSVAVADFNNDGKPDVGIANRSSQNTSIHLGD